MNAKTKARLWLPIVVLFAPGAGFAAAEKAPTPLAEVRYVELQPTFVTNYGYSETGRLKYLKADVTLRVSSQAAEMSLRYHLPYLRNNLVLLFSSQEESTLVSAEGRDELRRAALANLRELMTEEEGDPLIEDLVFSNFVVQR
jgi:flagellar FliL protein